MVEDGLSRISTMEAVMREGNVVDEFDLYNIVLGEGEQLTMPAKDVVDIDYKFCIKRRNNSYIYFYWNKFRNVTVGSMMRIKNLHKDNVIVIVK